MKTNTQHTAVGHIEVVGAAVVVLFVPRTSKIKFQSKILLKQDKLGMLIDTAHRELSKFVKHLKSKIHLSKK